MFGTWTTNVCSLTHDLIICLCMKSHLLGNNKIDQGIDLKV